MTPEDVAARFDDRPGHRLVDYRVVGLPVYRVFVLAVTISKKLLDPIPEFILRAVGERFETPEDVRGLLGLSERVVDACLAELVRTELLRVERGTDRAVFSVTSKGLEVIHEGATIKPSEQMLAFHFDGLTRRPRWYGDAELLAPRDLKASGIPELPSFPPRGPAVEELDVRDVASVIELEAADRRVERELLRIKAVERRQRLYKDAVALAYRAEDGGIQVGFAIEGRLSEEHELAFARASGLEKTRLFREVRGQNASREVRSDPMVADLIARLPESGDSQNLSKQATQARSELAALRTRALHGAGNTESGSEAASHLRAAQARVVELEAALRSLPVRAVAVYEHPTLLHKSLREAEERLLIQSPWIRSAVVDYEFLQLLEGALRRGTRVLLGFGLGQLDEDEGPNDRDARLKLEELARRHDRFVLRRLGDSHAKVLIKDREFYVITSFNWLSFRGDPKRPFREEWGTLVAIPDQVDELFAKLAPRFA